MRLKKAFQLVENNMALMYSTTKIKVAHTLLNNARVELVNAVVERDNEIARLLKEEFGYLMGMNDIVTYNFQTNEIFIYERNDKPEEYKKEFNNI